MSLMSDKQRSKIETQLRRATKRAMRPFRKADHNRQPPYEKIRKQLVKELEPLLEKIRLDAARQLIAKHGTAALPADWTPPPSNRAAELVADMIDVSKRRWKEMAKPRSREDVLKWRKRNLGDKRAELVSITELTMARQAGQDAAWAHLKAHGRMIEGYWRCEPNYCQFCGVVKDQPEAMWRKVYPSGPPSPHAGCRCEIEHVNRVEQALNKVPVASKPPTKKAQATAKRKRRMF